MSVLQAIGIILGGFPLAITALNNHQEVATRLRLFSKMKLEYRKCSNELELQQLTFTSHLKQLLLPIIVDDEKVQELIDQPAGEAWRDPFMVELLEKRLGNSYKLYQDYIKGMNSVMDDLCRELALDDEFLQSKLTDTTKRRATVARIKSVFGKDDLPFSIFRLKFSNGQSVRTKLFAELQAYNDKLDRLLDSSDRVSALEQQRVSKYQAKTIESSICNFWIHANKLFQALATAWKCHCREHCARLLLQHRATKSTELELLFIKSLPSYWEVTKAKISNVGNLIGESASANGPLKVVEKLPLRQPNHRSYHPTKSALKSRAPATQTKFLRPPPSITITEAVMNLEPGTDQPISNLCEDLKQSDGSCCGYLTMDEENCRYLVYTVSSHCRNSITSISLNHILRGDVSPPPTRQQRYAISLVLASSFLQLLETPWLTSSFCREDITFFNDPTNPNVFLLDQPNIARVLVTNPSMDGVAISLAQSLDQFGILLLELCFGKLLADQPLREKWGAAKSEEEQAGFDALAAREWQLQVLGEAGIDYSEAVAWCLGGNRSTPPERWRQDMLRKVVLPLQRCQEYFIASRIV